VSVGNLGVRSCLVAVELPALSGFPQFDHAPERSPARGLAVCRQGSWL